MLGHGRCVYPAVVFHHPQRPIDLLMSGGPEISDGAIEPVGQFVARTGLFAQRHQDRMGQCHRGSIDGLSAGYATRCIERQSSRACPVVDVYVQRLVSVTESFVYIAVWNRRNEANGSPHRAVHGGNLEETFVTYTIAEPCVDIKDKACIEECPVDCIYEGARMLYIHPDECVDCGACEPVCPVEAIYYEDDVPDQWSEYTQINADFFVELGSPGGAAKVGMTENDPQVVKDLPPQGEGD